MRPPHPGPLADLHDLLVQKLADSRDNTLPPMGPQDLIRALNLTLRPAERFNVGQQNCPVEFLTQVFGKLTLNAQHLTIHRERGHCGVCQGLVEEVRRAVLLPFIDLLQRVT